MSKKSVYTPTFMEKLLGRNYKWWYLMIHTFKSATTYRVSNFFYTLQSLLFTGVNLLVWWVNYQGGSEILTFKETFTYFIIGLIFGAFTEINFYHPFSNDIKNGKISQKLIYPVSLYSQYLFRKLGSKLFFNVDIIIWFLIVLFGSSFLVMPSLQNFGTFLIMGVLCTVSTYYLSIILGSISFFITENEGLIDFIGEIKKVSSGQIIPLNLFWATGFLVYTPFAYSFYHPMQIYLGKYTLAQTSWTLLGGITWCFVLYLLARFVFKAGLKRNEAVGL